MGHPAASKRPVVDGAVAVVGETAQIVHGDADRSSGEGAGDDSVFQDAGEEAWKDGDDVELHVLKIASQRVSELASQRKTHMSKARWTRVCL